MKIELQRLYLTAATHGLLLVDGQPIAFTIELPWAANQHSISCIPEGTYQLKSSYNAQFKEHIALLDVPNRSGILLHPANHAQGELRGCIAPVTHLIGIGWGNYSRLAMSKLNVLVQAELLHGPVTLEIVHATDPDIIEQLVV